VLFLNVVWSWVQSLILFKPGFQDMRSLFAASSSQTILELERGGHWRRFRPGQPISWLLDFGRD
jgi:hypothetical protein